jgi:hypothetical protein
MKNGWKIIASLVVLGLVLPTAYSQRSIGVETSPLQGYAGLGTMLLHKITLKNPSTTNFFRKRR